MKEFVLQQYELWKSELKVVDTVKEDTANSRFVIGDVVPKQGYTSYTRYITRIK